MKQQCHQDSTPLVFIRYKATQKAMDTLRALLDIAKVLGICYLYASLQGSHFDDNACGKHQQSLYDDDVEIREMHPTLPSNRMIVSSMIADAVSQNFASNKRKRRQMENGTYEQYQREQKRRQRIKRKLEKRLTVVTEEEKKSQLFDSLHFSMISSDASDGEDDTLSTKHLSSLVQYLHENIQFILILVIVHVYFSLLDVIFTEANPEVNAWSINSYENCTQWNPPQRNAGCSRR
ncbi:hypothetical protein pdam_00002373 [Pocillopora damicornis]|uniref:Uncharacterized protein n=1 Tax=Pocillopora damicornis TaxID=46731 RepID=A0A3M6USK8_POCDA|nr:hypothetical protein pdam_00002373 [Pocillopora damicornis]